MTFPKRRTDMKHPPCYRIKNWSRFQHFRDRRPPWIKLYRDLLDDFEWHQLDPLAAKSLLSFWLIASENEGNLPPSDDLAFRLRTTEKVINSVISKLSHWLEGADIKVASEGYQTDTPEESRVEKEKEDISPPPNGISPDDMARLWNEGIEFYSKEREVVIPTVKVLTPDRKKKALSRIKDSHITEEVWREVINAVHKSFFLSGDKPTEGHPSWCATFDFVIKSQSTIARILEGGYK